MQTSTNDHKPLPPKHLRPLWRVAYGLRDEKVAGSNPVTPTFQKTSRILDSFPPLGPSEKTSRNIAAPISAPINDHIHKVPRSALRVGRPPRDHIPQMRMAKGKFARVTIDGKEHRLGPWGSDEARERYDLLIQTWLANGRSLGSMRAVTVEGVDELAEAYLEWCSKTFKKNGRLTSTFATTQRALSLLYSSGHALCHREEFGPKHLSEYRKWLAIHGKTYVSGRHTKNGKPTVGKLTRGTINRYVQVVVAMFKWAVSEELVPETNFMALKSLPPTRRRRPIPGADVVVREHTPVVGVPKDVIDATCKKLSPTVASMVQLQLATGMRPIEICGLRRKFLRQTKTAGVWAYDVPHQHTKLDHMEIDRTVYLGPKAMKILEPILPDDPNDYVFSPARARAAQDAKRRSERSLPQWPSHDPALRMKRRARSADGGRKPGLHYTTASYAKAIDRACVAAELHPSQFWSPNQLRHNAATEFANSEKLEVAQLLLGHKDIKTTMRYVAVKERKAESAARRLA